MLGDDVPVVAQGEQVEHHDVPVVARGEQVEHPRVAPVFVVPSYTVLVGEREGTGCLGWWMLEGKIELGGFRLLRHTAHGRGECGFHVEAMHDGIKGHKTGFLDCIPS